MTKLKLSSGTTYCYGNQGERICTGSQMGRRNLLPDDRAVAVKLRMERLKWIDGDYDQWGAYWGQNGCNHIYCAWHDQSQEDRIEVFVRAVNRKDAKEQVRESLPNAIFCR